MKTFDVMEVIIITLVVIYFATSWIFCSPNQERIYIQKICVDNNVFHVVKTENSYTNFQYVQVFNDIGKPAICTGSDGRLMRRIEIGIN